MRSVADVLPRRLIDRDTPGVKTISLAGSAVRVVGRSLVRGQFLGVPTKAGPHPAGSRFTTIAIASPTVAGIPADSLRSGPMPQWVAELAAGESST